MKHIPKKAIIVRVIEYLGEILVGFRLLPQDFFDSLASHLSAGLALSLFVLLIARMYFYRSIECFVPSEWPDPWEHAAEAYCYMEGTYAVPQVNLNKTGPDAWEVKVPQTYYYWLPLILMVLAIILKAPDALWSLYCQQSDKQPGETLKAVALLTEGTETALKGKAEARQLSRQLGEHLMSETSRLADFQGGSLFYLYLVSKGLRLAATVGSLAFLQRSFGLSSPLFGLLAWLRAGDQGAEGSVGSFPTLTFCDVALRHLAGWSVRTVQCVLPINLLLDKIAVFLWFWLATCSLLCFGSAVVWMVCVGSEARRHRYVRTFVRVMRRQRRRLRRIPGEKQEPEQDRKQEPEQDRKQEPEQDRKQEVEQDQKLEPVKELEQVQPVANRRGKTQKSESPIERALIRSIGTLDRVFFLRLVQDRLGMVAAYVAMEAMTAQYLREHQADLESV